MSRPPYRKQKFRLSRLTGWDVVYLDSFQLSLNSENLPNFTRVSLDTQEDDRFLLIWWCVESQWQAPQKHFRLDYVTEAHFQSCNPGFISHAIW